MRDRFGHIVWPSYEAMPPEAGVYCDPSDGQYKRNVPLPLGGADLNGERIAVNETDVRPVALSLEEARAYHRDYFHPAECPCGQSFETWIRGGTKRERERPENVRGNVVLEQSASPKSMSVRDFRAAGGRWPPEPSSDDDYRHLLERRGAIEQAIREVEASKAMYEAFGASLAPLNDQLRRYRRQLTKIERAIAGHFRTARGGKSDPPDQEQQDLIAGAERIRARGEQLDRHSLSAELCLTPRGLDDKLRRAGLGMTDLRNRRYERPPRN